MCLKERVRDCKQERQGSLPVRDSFLNGLKNQSRGSKERAVQAQKAA